MLTDSKGNLIQSGALGSINLGGAAPTGYTWTANGQPDPTATAKSVASANYAFTQVQAAAVIGNSQTIAAPGSLVQQNTDSKGNVLASTGVGPAGVTVADKNGNTTTVGASSISVVGPNGSVTIADPSVIVTNGTAAGTTNITNGTVVAGTSVNAPQVNAIQVNAAQVNATQINAAGVGIGGATAPVQGLAVLGGTTTDTLAVTNGASVAGGLLVTGGVSVTGGLTADKATVTGNTTTDTLTVNHAATVKGPLTVQGPAQFNGGIAVAPSQTIDFGGNVVSGVATPKAPTDAANKSYVDNGLQNLLNIEKADVKKINGGIAAAFASAGPDRTGNQTGALAFNGGFWNGHTAFGVSGIQRIADYGSWDISIGLSGAVADTGDVGGRATVQFGWGGAPVPLK